ncbi:Protein-export protein SecB [Jannaschia seosinensis]|uniref:Protein-export protein SecB n=1 Tax=Jannaschia seosinensis TaxID=313367 RepID=A0A0M7BDH7_9RHOB|nr:protein-export chaperone SecB [Jannaschia seosinensis]CUH39405.1 Protein-export protein SecB [Jannaschia seosinensis]
MADEDQTTPTETNGAAAPGQEQQAAPQMKVLGQFIRDLSFENVSVQKGRTSEGQPDIAVQVGLEGKKRPTEDQFEVVVKLKVTAKAKESEDVIFAMELDYAGIFQITGVPEKQMHPFLMIECPRMLFPFLRRIVSDVSRDGGYPPLNLETIDFVSLYRNEITRRAQAEAAQVTPS